jgi:hypothetical protein
MHQNYQRLSQAVAKKLHNEERHNLYSSPSIIRIIKEDEMGTACSTNGEKRTVHSILVGKPEGWPYWPKYVVIFKL